MVPPSAMRILDIGCSNGALGASLRKACPTRKVVGIEGNAGFAAEAERHLDLVMCADLNRFDWSTAMNDMRFDCIIFADVLEHLVDPGRHIVEAQRFLQPGGCIVISLPNIRHASSLYSIFIKGTFPRRDRGIFDKTHLRWFTIQDAKALIADAGMRVDDISYSLRLGDKGGGMMNRIVNRAFSPIQQFYPVREFLTYQFCLRAVKCK
jgi:2-polyprenyl-3-methyl-5-hydroxy-6-metoxy-1,4-benzoquinol methylase